MRSVMLSLSLNALAVDSIMWTTRYVRYTFGVALKRHLLCLVKKESTFTTFNYKHDF